MIDKRSRSWANHLAALAIPCVVACGSSSHATVFDPTGAGMVVDIAATSDVERPFPAFDGPTADQARWIGVSVLRDAVRFSRPSHWTIRDASLEPGHSYVRYVSPDAYSFAIYERDDDTGKSWPNVCAHYEADVSGNGAKALGQRVPMATAVNQGRAYTIDRKIASKVPVLSRSREILIRSDHRIVLVQVVTTEENLARIAGDILEILRRLEVE
jgi:hypothetical protein